MQESLEVEGIELTEALVLTRTRAPDLESVRKLNCWASQINDVQVVRRMPNLEVCSLSINRISSLRDFAHCHKLKELYVRTNNINQLGDVHYLKSLPRLRSLWLSENPCANTPNYRATVLKSLPNLQKLDNRAVTSEEVETAAVEGDDIPVPDDFSASSFITASSLTDTQSSLSSSINSQSSSIRRKREQRRQKIAAVEEAARRSQEGESCSSSRSEEDQSPCEKSDDASRSDSDTGWQGAKESIKSTSDYNVSQPLPSVADSMTSVKEENYDVGDLTAVGEESVQNTLLEVPSSVEASVNEEERNASNETNIHSTELCISPIESPSEENNNCDVIKDSDENHTPNVSESQSDEDQKLINNTDMLPSNPLLDKIRLNDSLNCAESQDVVESIALDDLVIELAPEAEKDDTITTEDQKGDKGSEVNETPVVSEEKETKEAKVLPVSNSTQSESTIFTSEQAEGGKSKDDDIEKSNGLLNWEEHNRLRAELGVKQMERMSVKSSYSDVNRLRNSNILQAVLSLVKELDKDSLDIVQSAVHSRMERL